MRKIVSLVVAIVAACAAIPLLGAAAIFGGGGVNCAPATTPGSAPPSPPQMPAVDGWDAEQVSHVGTIITVGNAKGVPPWGWVVAVATAMQESGLRNLPAGDRDSIGLFQQRPSQGWGTPEQLADPSYQAGKFFDKLLTVDGWQQMPLTDAAQAVQLSAYPSAYEKWTTQATRLVSTVGAALGLSTGGINPCSGISPQGWTQPVHAPIVSGFRTASRPTHQGVDLAATRGTPIQAASTGVVSRVRCNAVHASDGSDWGCDRDGDPVLTRGCGWYVDLLHADRIITRYCHMLTRPAVAEGQPVIAGQVIGIVGSSGHSSGPHLHYEVHVRREALNNRAEVYEPVDPVAFHAQVGAPLGAA